MQDSIGWRCGGQEAHSLFQRFDRMLNFGNRRHKAFQASESSDTFEQIDHQLNIERSTAYKAWERTLKRLPKANVEALRAPRWSLS
jgi:hypothetical protein